MRNLPGQDACLKFRNLEKKFYKLCSMRVLIFWNIFCSCRNINEPEEADFIIFVIGLCSTFASLVRVSVLFSWRFMKKTRILL